MSEITDESRLVALLDRAGLRAGSSRPEDDTVPCAVLSPRNVAVAGVGADIGTLAGLRVEDHASTARDRVGAPESAPAPDGSRARRTRIALIVVVALPLVLALHIAAPFAPALILAGWFAAITRPALPRLSTKLRGRGRAAALLTLALLFSVLVPSLLLVTAVALDLAALVQSLLGASSGTEVLRQLVAQDVDVGAPLSVSDVRSTLDRYAGSAVELLGGLASATSSVVMGMVVFFGGSYFFLTEGPRVFQWLVSHTPVPAHYLVRLQRAFEETGRGLLTSVVLTGACQSALATTAYLALGVPRAMVLGLATFVASLIPVVGTALVWVPVALGLAMSGAWTEGVVLAVVGMIMMAITDNVLRPLFARWGKLDLPPFVVLVATLGGLVALGPWGVLLGPLVVRLTLEGLRIMSAERRLGH